MPARSNSPRGAATRRLTLAIDVVLFTPQGSELAILLSPPTGRGRAQDGWSLPSGTLRGDESLNDAALRVASEAWGDVPSLLEQAAAIGGARRQPDGAEISIIYFGLVSERGDVSRHAGEWVAMSAADNLATRHRAAIDSALTAMRNRVDQQPIAFKLVPPSFTLSELQSVYELLLGRRLHKASFRRSLHASALVEATDEWRSEGRGRPAQLFRYAPPRRRRPRHGIRFDLLG